MVNRVALVTGASRGIGKAIALGFAQENHRVVLVARDRDKLNSVREEFKNKNNIHIIAAYLSDRDAPKYIIENTISRCNKIDILVNNAGIGSSQNPNQIIDFDDNAWDLTLAVNITAPYLLIKYSLPIMIKKRWGRIINIASVYAKIAGQHTAAYTASKHALVGLTKAVATEVSQYGITTNAICPGVTRTVMNDKRLRYDSTRLNIPFEVFEKKASPLGRRLEPEEIANMAIFLSSAKASGINSQAINVCGGWVVN